MHTVFEGGFFDIWITQILSVLSYQFAVDEDLARKFTVDLLDQLEVSVIARGNGTNIAQAFFSGTVDGRHA